MKRPNLELAYSIAVICVIPLLLVINTVWLATNARDDFNLELQRKADLVNLTVANASLSYIEESNTQGLSDFLTKLEADSPAVSNLYITNLEGNEVQVLAASANSSVELQPFQEQQIKIAANSGGQPIARLDDATDALGQPTKAWTLATPVYNDEGTLIAIAMSSTATTDADESFDKTFMTSLIVLAGSVLVSIGLLIHHYRLAGYSKLLAKQKEINQTMNNFLSVATHELKAPTSIIKGYISNVTDGTFGDIPVEATKQLNVAFDQTDRLNNLVKDLLNVSRIEQGRINYDLVSVNLPEVISLVRDTYIPLAQDKGLEIVYQPAQNIPNVYVDVSRAQEIFTNLVDNAVKYTSSGTITISHESNKKMLITKVRDTGHGMSAEERKNLFQRFYRVKNEHTQNISGTGLGLWIIKKYIEEMGGQIEVDSLVGSGTEFTVYLPIVNEKH